MTAVPSGWTPEQAKARLEAAVDAAYPPSPRHGRSNELRKREEALADMRALLALLDKATKTLAECQRWLVVPSDVPTQHHEALGRARESALAFLARFAAPEDNA